MDAMKKYVSSRKSSALLQYGIACRSQAMIRHLGQFKCSASDTLLDIGAADGLVTHNLVECFGFGCHTGIDIRLDYLRAAKGNITNVTQADGRYLPFPDSSVDVIVSTAVFKHVNGLDQLLQECHRVLKPDGKLAVIDPTPLGIRCGIMLGHFSPKSIVQILSLHDLERMLDLHGFTTVSKGRFMLAPVPFPGGEALERRLRRWRLDHAFLQQIICARQHRDL
jgi:SAM-dependent methyltransferase